MYTMHITDADKNHNQTYIGTSCPRYLAWSSIRGYIQRVIASSEIFKTLQMSPFNDVLRLYSLYCIYDDAEAAAAADNDVDNSQVYCTSNSQ